MSILTDPDPLNKNICIFSAFDEKKNDHQNVSFVSVTKPQRHKGHHKMIKCSFNALAFLFLVSCDPFTQDKHKIFHL